MNLQPLFSYKRASTQTFGRITLLFVILAVAIGLRLYGIGWSLPYTDHPDEPSAVNRVFEMLRHDDWNPRFFGKPSLYYYALRLVFAAHLRYGIATGLYESINSLPATTDRYVTTPEFFVWGRVLTAVLGAATVALLYFLGQRWWNRSVGLAAAALLAVAPYHVRNSQYITQDVPMALMALIALIACLSVLRKPNWQSYALAGISIGLATSTKYNVALVALTLSVVHVQVWGRTWLRQAGWLVWAGAWSLLAFAITTPYAVLMPDTFFNGLFGQYTAYNPGGAPTPFVSGSRVAHYLRFFWDTGLYPLPCLAALLGGGVVIARRDRAGIALLAFVVIYPLVFMIQQAQFDRNLLPVIPPLLILAAIGVVTSARYLALLAGRSSLLQTWPGKRWLFGSIATVLLVALLAAPAQRAIGQDRFYAQQYSKIRVSNYVKTELPQGAPMALALNPQLWNDKPFVITLKDVTKYDASWYRAQGFRYLIANVDESPADRYTALRDAASRVEVFAGGDQTPGPVMEVLDLGQHFDQLAIERREAEFGGQLRLLGFQRGAGALRTVFAPLAGTANIQAGQVLQLNIYWQPITPIAHDYAIFLHLLNAEGQKVTQRDTVIRGADYPTSHWVSDELAIDLADLPLPADLPAGEYQLVMGVYDMANGQRLGVSASADAAIPLLTFQLPAP